MVIYLSRSNINYYIEVLVIDIFDMCILMQLAGKAIFEVKEERDNQDYLRVKVG